MMCDVDLMVLGLEQCRSTRRTGLAAIRARRCVFSQRGRAACRCAVTRHPQGEAIPCRAFPFDPTQASGPHWKRQIPPRSERASTRIAIGTMQAFAGQRACEAVTSAREITRRRTDLMAEYGRVW